MGSSVGRGSTAGRLVGRVIPLSADEISEMSALSVRVGKGGNADVGRSGDPRPVGKSGVGITPPMDVRVGTSALAVGSPDSGGNSGSAPTLGVSIPEGGVIPGTEGSAVASATPGTEVRRRGGEMSPPTGGEAFGRLGPAEPPTLPMGGKVGGEGGGKGGGKAGGRGKAGEAEARRA